MVKRAGPGISGSGLGMEAAGITARSAALCCNGAVEVEKTGPTSGPRWSAAQGGTRLLGRLAVGAGLQRLGVGSLAHGPRSGLRGVLAWGDWSAGPGCREAEGESAARWRAGGIGTGRRASWARGERGLVWALAGPRGELGRAGPVEGWTGRFEVLGWARVVGLGFGLSSGLPGCGFRGLGPFSNLFPFLKSNQTPLLEFK